MPEQGMGGWGGQSRGMMAVEGESDAAGPATAQARSCSRRAAATPSGIGLSAGRCCLSPVGWAGAPRLQTLRWSWQTEQEDRYDKQETR
jgi:hypothetical protein